MRLIVRPTASTGLTGKYVIIPNYGTTPTPPADFVQASNVEGNVVSSLWLESSSRVDVAATRATGSRKYVRDDASTDTNTEEYDALTFYIYGNCVSDVSKFATVLIEYNIDFYVPVVAQTGGVEVDGEFYQIAGNDVFGTGGDPIGLAYGFWNNVAPTDYVSIAGGTTGQYVEVNSGAVTTTDNKFVVENDGYYCITFDADCRVTNESKQPLVATIGSAICVNGERVLATADVESVEFEGGLASEDDWVSVVSELIIPLVKGTVIDTELYWFNSWGENVEAFLNAANLTLELVGALVA